MTQDVFIWNEQWRNEHTVEQQIKTTAWQWWKILKSDDIYLMFNTGLRVRSSSCSVVNLPASDDLSRSKCEIIENNERALLFLKRIGNLEWEIVANTTEKNEIVFIK